MLHAKVGSCWKDPTGHVHMEVDSFDASKQREDRNLLQVELARIHTADTQHRIFLGLSRLVHSRDANIV